MEVLFGLLGYAVFIAIGLFIAGIPIGIAIIVRSGINISAKVICPQCGEKIKPQKTGQERLAGLKQIKEEVQCPLCKNTWWELA